MFSVYTHFRKPRVLSAFLFCQKKLNQTHILAADVQPEPKFHGSPSAKQGTDQVKPSAITGSVHNQ